MWFGMRRWVPRNMGGTLLHAWPAGCPAVTGHTVTVVSALSWVPRPVQVNTRSFAVT
jgi:hypothetical protein